MTISCELTRSNKWNIENIFSLCLTKIVFLVLLLTFFLSASSTSLWTFVKAAANRIAYLKIGVQELEGYVHGLKNHNQQQPLS